MPLKFGPSPGSRRHTIAALSRNAPTLRVLEHLSLGLARFGCAQIVIQIPDPCAQVLAEDLQSGRGRGPWPINYLSKYLSFIQAYRYTTTERNCVLAVKLN